MPTNEHAQFSYAVLEAFLLPGPTRSTISLTIRSVVGLLIVIFDSSDGSTCCSPMKIRTLNSKSNHPFCEDYWQKRLLLTVVFTLVFNYLFFPALWGTVLKVVNWTYQVKIFLCQMPSFQPSAVEYRTSAVIRCLHYFQTVQETVCSYRSFRTRYRVETTESFEQTPDPRCAQAL